ncbi:MAG: LPS export ABC transporter ATP-binding protein [Deltaproteobacteria bacterium]|nr:LPS export ABC transporter ATP-binding protein [Deltaproteobacteria bacterium]MBT6432576.1 LPS export ABC transporter ATP-binding protein [Deltaproteobacteria bacterium]MBT6489318.1 LPS export ABC transporter ATP-binding protein [Deltaproteobacteria bacterium]
MTQRLQAQGLSKSYKGREVVKGISFDVCPGEIVGLLGPNGAGKTTSFNMIAGLVRADAGEVHLGESSLSGLPLFKRARLGLGYLPQESTIFRGLTVQQNFEAVYEALGYSRQDTKQKSKEMVKRFNLEHVRENLGSQLSGGERRRVEMARTLIPKPSVVLLDEPFAGVDPIAVGDIRGFISEMRAADIGILITDHNVRETLGICTRSYIIAEGKILISGPPEKIIANDVARRTYLGENFTL